MNANMFKRFCALALAFFIVVGLMPVDAHAAEDSVVVIAASDYQLSNSGTIMTNIMNQIKDDYGSAYGILMGGDYDAGSVNTTANHIKNVDSTISGVFPEIASDNRIYIQGNHENYAGLKVDGSNLMDYSGAHDTDYYGVYVINHDDFPWSTSSNPKPSASLVQSTADALGNYLEAKVAEGYEKPIFVTSHLPLHATTRGDNKYARLIFDELEAAGEAGLNIIFLVGHNHSGGYDAYLGNGSFYMPVGSSLTVVDGSSGTYTDDSISFTYLNYGYLGKLAGSACTHQTMTVFEITGSQVTVKRYDESGLHKLKAAGVASGSFAANTTVIGTEGATIELGEPVPVVTVTDGNVTVSSAGLTGLTATKRFGTESTENYDSATYAAYASYDIVPQGYTDGKSATVTITLDEADGFDASRSVTVIDAEKGTEQRKTIENGAVTFTTNHFSTYHIAQRSASADYTYELVTSIEAGGKYVIVGDSHAVALMDSNGSLGSQEVTIDGTTLTSETELTEWTFSSASSGTITSSDGNKLGYSSSSWNLTGSGDCSFDIAANNSTFSLRVIRSSSGYNRYYFNYDGSSWASKPTSADYVRLYQLTSEGSGSTEPTDPSEPTQPDTPEDTGDWIALPAGNSYTLDTDGIDNGAKYLIVAKSYAKALSAASGSSNAVDVTIDGNNATADAAYGWTFTSSGSGYQIQKDGTYLGRSNTSVAAGNSGSVWTVANNGSGSYSITQSGSNSGWWGNSSYYLRWSNSNGYFQASNYSTDPVRLYRYNGSGSSIGANYIRLDGEIEQTYSANEAVTADAVLAKLLIQTSDDGVNADTTSLAVTSDMVTWTPAFDGTVAGTYVGTVSYEGQDLGTVTVTINPAEHNFETVTVEATCTEDGSITTTCTICGEQTVEVIKATGHDYECVETAANCGTDGSKVYTCKACQDTYSEVIPATGEHNFETVTVDATCAEAGSVTTTCTVCGEQTVEIIEALEHEYECVETAATCGVEGSKVYTCSACGDTYTETIPATGDHVFETVTVDATCTETGSVTSTCTVCGHVAVETIEALGHQYDITVTDPTCTEAGATTYTCTVCGSSYSEAIAATGHSYTSQVTAPTCTEGGFTTYVCGTCGHSYTDSYTEALGHDYDSKDSATCTETGFVVYTCKICSHSYNGEATAALGHAYTTSVVAPSCDKDGYTTFTCTTCGDTYIGDYVAAPGHAYETAVKEATCTEAGFTTYTCTVCGYTYDGDHVAALGHQYESVVTEPTFETEGFTTHTCVVCGDVKVDSYVPVLSHDYESVTVDATCTTDGYTTYTCITCGYSYTDTIPALGHSYEITSTEPTCTEDGAVISACSVCGHVDTQVIPALGHTYETVVVDPTCTEEGRTTYTCACGDIRTETVPALGHNYQTTTQAPTCTATGLTTHTCAACGDTTSEVIPALGHSYVTASVAPTCTADGYTTYTCTTCGDSYTADAVPALGHDHEAVVTAPTCTEAGFTTYTCQLCGDSYVADQTAALGHSYTSQEQNGYMVYTCGNCGDSYSEKIQTVSYNKVTSLSSNNRYVITLYSGNKYYALSHEDNEISLVQVTVSDGVVTSEVTEDLIWTYNSKKLSYQDGNTTYYLYAKTASGWWGWMSTPTLTLSTSSSSNVSLSSNKLKVGSYYLRYSNGTVALNRSATTTYLYKEVE